MNKNTIVSPKTGFPGLKQNWKVDMPSGFMVFLLALPLSLGIAKASGFPASMGVLTAMVGGLFTVFFKVSELTIKGPAAGLITICSGAVLEFGGSEQGWKIATAAIMVAAVIQIAFALLKLGSLSDFFPHSAVHGMLAAIGIIIIAKQIPVLLGDDPAIYKGEGPIELILDIPNFITHAHWHIAVVGILGVLIMFGLPMIGIKFLKKVPAPMVVLLLAIPLSVFWHFNETEPDYSLVSIGDFWGSLGFNFDFSMIATGTFWKYVFMFLFVNSLESLLTVKAVDNLDPYKRTSSYNGDLMGVGSGNFISGMLGGLPMISEVVRSSANIGFGAKTKWSNFFHGGFLLLAMIFVIPLIELIPNAALAAMLIFAGYRLAAPREFLHTYHIGKEQLVIFLTTIIVTLAEDLLMGIAAGILVKFLIHIYNGASLKSLFKVNYDLDKSDHFYHIKVYDAAVFSNLIGYKKLVTSFPEKFQIKIDFSAAKLVDHSFMAFITHFKNEYNDKGGDFQIIGFDNHDSLSDHPLSTKKLTPSN
ncbi:SulP family inorganic anion transporter [Cyclobacterium jeungdonense]|uniref:SulP family inorganic anion transporter n=1 Tax=Cyclobacterium jeungdonense TaxID=708087 RepID=A0ABT8C5J2_9BACT|nr:SulP family inorganic anion transporter [Cyclobacterium jeungdonense]MDN3687576.1 SulP family inorganic anion transporter [Cyclobacterium jeungdonense]